VAQQTFGEPDITAEHIGERWTVEVANYKRHGRLMREIWGMQRDKCDAVSLLEAVCSSRSVVLHTDEGVLDVQATFAAQAKCEEVTQEFQKWIFGDPERTQVLVAEYNRRFTSLRAPRYDGSKLRLPGRSDHFVSHFYQRNAVARIIAEPATLLDHVVGAGKAGTMLMATMELRRLGVVRQPWIVVPNQIIEQVGREAAQWYPAAKILLHCRRPAPVHRPIGSQRMGHRHRAPIRVHRNRCRPVRASTASKPNSTSCQLQSAESDRTKKAVERAIKTAQERSIDDVELSTAEWVTWYIQERLHEALGYVLPAEHEAALTGTSHTASQPTPALATEWEQNLG